MYCFSSCSTNDLQNRLLDIDVVSTETPPMPKVGGKEKIKSLQPHIEISLSRIGTVKANSPLAGAGVGGDVSSSSPRALSLPFSSFLSNITVLFLPHCRPPFLPPFSHPNLHLGVSGSVPNG